MNQKNKIIFRGETSTLETNPVESFPVKVDKKLFSDTPKFIGKEYTSCPNCTKTATSYDEIIRNFGLRNMGDGTIRVQSWCKECRNHSKGVII